jgi:hypothetical protein
VVRVAGVLEQAIPEGVVIVGAAHLHEHVLIAVVVEIPERDAVPFWRWTETGRLRDVLEASAGIVAERDVRPERREERIARAEVEILIAVVVEVAEVRAHREEHAVQPALDGHVVKPTLAIALVELHGVRRHDVVSVKRGDLLRALRLSIEGRRLAVVGRQQIEVPIVVVIEEPGREPKDRIGHARFRGHVGEREIAVVVVEAIGAPKLLT